MLKDSVVAIYHTHEQEKQAVKEIKPVQLGLR